MSEGEYLYDESGKPINRDDTDSDEDGQENITSPVYENMPVSSGKKSPVPTQSKSPPKRVISVYDEDLYSLPNVDAESPNNSNTTTTVSPTPQTTPKTKPNPNPKFKNETKWKIISGISFGLLVLSFGANIALVSEKYYQGM